MESNECFKIHDEDFKIELDNLRMNLGKTTITGRPPKFVFDLPEKIKFQDKITTNLIEKVTSKVGIFILAYYKNITQNLKPLKLKKYKGF